MDEQLVHSIPGPSLKDVDNVEGGRVKNWKNLPKDSSEKVTRWGGGVENPEKMPTSLINGPFEPLVLCTTTQPRPAL